MSNSTVRLYDLLKTEYPTATYLGQIDQSVDLKSTTGIVLLKEVSESTSPNKDDAKRDQIVYNINVIGTLQKTVDAICENVRDLVEPYTDEYIMRMVYDSSAKEFDEDAEIYEKVMQFTCWPQKEGLNIPSGYWEYYAYMNYLTGAITVLNQNELNYMPISWTYNEGVFTTTYTYNANDIEFFWLLPNLQGSAMQVVNTAFEGTLTVVASYGDVLQDMNILIRVRKSAVGSFVTGT